MKKVLTMLALLVFCLANVNRANAQDKPVQGVVKDDTGQPLPGATVKVKGTSFATTTDVNGAFKINVADNGTLVVSFVSFEPQEVPVAGQATFNISLKPAARNLNEVVVVGYGAVRKRDLTGAVSTVRGDQITKVATSDPVQALQGQVAGVQIVGNSGEPGSGSRIQIRGVGSINGGNPIYVVDGYQTGDISYLSPGDIETIDVLKDASAAAIYGARGANGVVVVTTKKGKKGPLTINFDAYGGMQQAWRKIPLTNAAGYATLVEEGYLNDGLAVPANIKPRLDAAIAGQIGAGTNWQNEVFQNAPIQNYSLALAGGGDINKFRVSGTYFNQEGIIKNTGLRKYFFNLNDDITVSKWLNAGVTGSFTHSDRNIYNGDLYGGVLPNALSADPIAPAFNTQTNNWGRPEISAQSNPARIVSEISGNRNYYSSLVGNVWAEAKIVKGLSFKTQFGATYSNTHNTSYLPQFFIDPTESRGQSSLYDYRSEDVNWVWSNYFNYNQTFGKHRIAAIAGYEVQSFSHDGVGATGYGISANRDLQYLGLAQSTNYTVTSDAFGNGLQSIFGRVNYTFNDKYLLTATVRRDASSKFLGSNQSGIFPSFAGAWTISEEGFLKGSKTINLLKLRAGWGRVGNEQSSSAYPYIASITGNNLYVFGNSPVQGFAASILANPNLKWETNEQYNIGLDGEFFDSHLTASVDYFSRKTKDMIVLAPTPAYVGTGAPYVNNGSMENKGVEVSIGYKGGDKFKYNINANATYVKNNLLSLGGSQFQQGGYVDRIGNTTAAQPGQPFPYFFGVKTAGLFHSQEEVDAYTGPKGLIQPLAKPGDVKYVDANGDGVIDDNDRVNLGNPYPKITYGLNTDFSYKQFDLRLFFQGVWGNKLLNGLINRTGTSSNAGGGWTNFYAERLNRWTPQNPTSNEPRMTASDLNNNIRYSDRYISSGSYLRLRNVQLGYNFAKASISKLGLKTARVYLASDNLFTITKYKGFDPEISGYYSDPMYTGVDVGNYPQARSFRIGLSVGL